MERTEDVQLAEELLSGDAAAFEGFVDAYHSKVFQYAYLMCGNRENAEEVSQETLLDVFRNIAVRAQLDEYLLAHRNQHRNGIQTQQPRL